MKRIMAPLAAAALLIAALVTGSAGPASAHTGNITVTGACVDSDTMTATYTAGWSNGTSTGKLYQRSGIHGSSGDAGSSIAGWTFVKNVSGAAGSDSFTITHERSAFSGGNGPWWSSKVVFSDGYGVAADTRIEGFDWDDCAPDTSGNKIEFCHAKGNGLFEKIETSKAAFYVGHREHGGDIYPAGSYEKGGQSYSWPAQGDQSLLGFTDCAKPQDRDWHYDVSCTGVSGTNPNYGESIDSNVRIKNLDTGVVQTFNYHGADNGSGGPFSWSFAAKYGLPSSWTYYEVQWVQVHGTNYHWEGSLVCGDKPSLIPGVPPGKDICGVVNDHNGLPSGPAGVTYARDGKDIIATIASTKQWGTLPAGWVKVNDTTARYAFDATKFTDEPCVGQPEPKAHHQSDEGCDLSEYGEGFGAGTVARDGVEPYVYRGQEWVLSGEITWGAWAFTPYDDDTYFEECAPPEPDEKVVYTDWEGGDYDCGDTTYTETRSKSVTPFVWDTETREWVEGETVTTTESRTADVPKYEDCPVSLVSPTVTQAVCTGPGSASDPSITLADDVEGLTYSLDGQTVKATLAQGFAFAAVPDGWSLINEGRAAVFNVVFDDPGACLVSVVPATFTVTPADCDIDGSLVIPDQPQGVLVSVGASLPSAARAATFGPGTYDVSFTAAAGYVLASNPSGQAVVVPEVTGEDCAPPQPEPLVEETSETSQECDATVKVTKHTVTTTEYVLDGETWVLGKPVTTIDVTKTPVKAEDCDKTPLRTTPPPPSTHLTSLPKTGRDEVAEPAGSDTGLIYGGLAGVGVLLMLGGLLTLRRRRA